MASSSPHPYQLATYSRHANDTAMPLPSHYHPVNQNMSDANKPPSPIQDSPQIPLPPAQQLRHTTSTRETKLFIKYRPLALLVIFTPIPPLLSLIYIGIGHAVLRHTHPPPDFSWEAPISSSIQAGATGGVILSLPIALLLYILVYPTPRSSDNLPEDFFEDDDASETRLQRLYRYFGYAVCVSLAFCVGAIAGPLGVTCLAPSLKQGQEAAVASSNMLSTGNAALAGLVGGVLLCGCILCVSVIGFMTWAAWLRNKPRQYPRHDVTT